MFAEERQEQIVNILKNQISIKVNELAGQFSVSETTIRRDLQEMELKGLLARTHGGAVRIREVNFEPPFFQKKDEMLEEKILIGKKAASMIEAGDTIILDSGTTTLEIAKNIEAKDITVITNSIDIAEELSNKNSIDLIVTGGSLRFTTRAMVGHITENVLSNFRVDKAFVGANGISVEYGITTPNFTEAQTKKAMIKMGSQVIIVADSSKFHKVCFSLLCEARMVTSIVTSKYVSNNIIKEFSDIGIQMIKSD